MSCPVTVWFWGCQPVTRSLHRHLTAGFPARALLLKLQAEPLSHSFVLEYLGGAACGLPPGPALCPSLRGVWGTHSTSCLTNKWDENRSAVWKAPGSSFYKAMWRSPWRLPVSRSCWVGPLEDPPFGLAISCTGVHTHSAGHCLLGGMDTRPLQAGATASPELPPHL